MATATGPTPFVWTRESYERAAQIGTFGDLRVELIEGQVLNMNPMNSPHATAIGLVSDALAAAFGKTHHVRVQCPLPLSDTTEPEPDIAVVRGGRRVYRDHHPDFAELVVEISDTTLEFDRSNKARIYAKAKIPEYWIVNLADEQIEVHRRPSEKKGRFSEYYVVARGEALSPIGAPKNKLRVDDLLP